jgi:hypothetical protein
MAAPPTSTGLYGLAPHRQMMAKLESNFRPVPISHHSPGA